MKKIKFENWLLKEAARLANVNSASIKKIATQNQPRANAYLAFYFKEKNTYSLLSNALIQTIAKTSLMIDYDPQLKKEFKKTHNLWIVSTQANNDIKKSLVGKLKNPKRLYQITKHLSLSYPNAYRFFVKKDLTALTITKAQEILLNQ